MIATMQMDSFIANATQIVKQVNDLTWICRLSTEAPEQIGLCFVGGDKNACTRGDLLG